MTQPQDKMRAEIIEAVRAAWHSVGIQDDGWDWADFSQEIQWNIDNPKCEQCDGSGERQYLSDNSPDAYEVTGACGGCNGNGTTEKQTACAQQSARPSEYLPDPGLSSWWSLAMGAAASLEDAANCLRDPDGKRAALGAAEHVRNACKQLYTQQSAQSQKDALDAARFRQTIRHVGGQRHTCCQTFGLVTLKPVSGNIMQGSVSEHFVKAIDAAIAAQGASNV